MLTRCPECQTHFRVTAEQLKSRSGRVRCGQCQNIFNALDTLIEEPIHQGMPVIERVPVAEQLAPPPIIPETDSEPIAEPDPVQISPEPITNPLPLDAVAVADQPLTEIPQSLTAEDHNTEVIEPAQPFGDGVERAGNSAGDWVETFPELPSRQRCWPWIFGGFMALLALSLQALIAFRIELAILWPDLRPALIALCDLGNCEVGLPAKVSLVGIEASDLHPDVDHPGRLALSATLKNRAPFAQQYPHLELTLTDIADKAVARKVIRPVDFLSPATQTVTGMLPNADITLAITIDASEIAASGYRLYLFYP